MDDETRARIAGMKRAGITMAEIAKRLGLTLAEVRRISRAAGAYTHLDHRRGGPRRNTYWQPTEDFDAET